MNGSGSGLRRRSKPTLPSRSGLAHEVHPASMSPSDRLAELGGILATAFRRLQLHQKFLAEVANPEAPSKGKEVA